MLHSDMPARYTLAPTSACSKGRDSSQAFNKNLKEAGDWLIVFKFPDQFLLIGPTGRDTR